MSLKGYLPKKVIIFYRRGTSSLPLLDYYCLTKRGSSFINENTETHLFTTGTPRDTDDKLFLTDSSVIVVSSRPSRSPKVPRRR